MITRHDYDGMVKSFDVHEDQIRRSINFLRIFNPELSSIAIERQCTRLEEAAQQLTSLSKQLRAEMK
jgi:hypothetical protein